MTANCWLVVAAGMIGAEVGVGVGVGIGGGIDVTAPPPPPPQPAKAITAASRTAPKFAARICLSAHVANYAAITGNREGKLGDEL